MSLFILKYSLSETCRCSAMLAHRLSLLNFLGPRYEIHYMAELLSSEVAIKACNYNYFTFICHSVDNFRGLIAEELYFINSYNISILKFAFLKYTFIEITKTKLCFSPLLIVCYYEAIATIISQITRMLYQKDLLALDSILLKTSQKFSTFAREHRSHYNLDATSYVMFNHQTFVL